MKYADYMHAQITSSEWTRQNRLSMQLVRDSAREFCRLAPKHGSVLELGCGDGYFLDQLRRKGYRRLLGVDINLAKLSVAARHGHRVLRQDIHRLAFANDSFDAIYCAHTLEHSHNGYLVMHEVFRVLRAGGIALVIVPDHFGSYGETFLLPSQVIPFEQRAPDHFEALVQARRGFRSPTNRNQFPLTMRLLVAVIFESGLELEQVARIQRDGPELWAIARKPAAAASSLEPLVSRPYKSRLTKWLGLVPWL